MVDESYILLCESWVKNTLGGRDEALNIKLELEILDIK